MGDVIHITWQRRLRHVIEKRAAESPLPKWWTDYPPARPGHVFTLRELENFYNGAFMREVLKHMGGMTTMPETKEKEDE